MSILAPPPIIDDPKMEAEISLTLQPEDTQEVNSKSCDTDIRVVALTDLLLLRSSSQARQRRGS